MLPRPRASRPPEPTTTESKRVLDPPKGEVLVFGYAAYGASTAMRERVAKFCLALGGLAKADLAVYEAESYEDLAQAMVRADVDFAWLPPLVFVALERRNEVVPLASAQRDGDTAFHSAIIVAQGSKLNEPEDLAGSRAAWVDRYSASGYVVPRVGLAAIGLDPRVAFSEERFLHSHEAVVRAVAAGRADFGATYVGLDANAQVVRGPWMDVSGAADAVRVLLRFGAIPGDIVASRSELVATKRDLITRALLAMSREDEHRELLRDTFGVEQFRRWVSAGYDALRRLAQDASKRGLLEGVAAPDEDEEDDEEDDDSLAKTTTDEDSIPPDSRGSGD